MGRISHHLGLLWLWLAVSSSGCRIGNGDPPSPERAAAGGAGGAADGFAIGGFTSLEDCLAHNDGAFVSLDRDGDGHSAYWLERCGEITPYRASRPSSDDCDDADPSVFQSAWRDADGDGWTTGSPQCLSALPQGYLAYRSSRVDCDDGQAALQQTAYRDEDGDGYGNPQRPVCIAETPVLSLSSGLSLSSDDCDDAAAETYPRAFEHWRDGVDSDCDGHDDPLVCTSERSDCGCQLLDTPAPASDSTCRGSDLFVVAQVPCPACEGRTVVVIGNRGALPASSVSLRVDGRLLPALEGLAAGAVTLPIRLPSGAQQLEIVPDANECNDSDNSAEIASSSDICDP